MHVVECAAAETRDQAPSRTTAMFAWDPYAAFFLGGGDDVTPPACSQSHHPRPVGAGWVKGHFFFANTVRPKSDTM